MVKNIFRLILSIGMVFAGVSHFTNSEQFIKIVPRYLPWPEMLVYVSGVFEILGGVGLLIPRLRNRASLGLVLLYVAVFPANIYMAMNQIPLGETPVPEWTYWARLPLQFVLIAWAIWVGRK